MGRAVLEARKVVKSFGQNMVLKGVNLRIEPGDRYFLFGPNGAGKTTLIKVLCGLLSPDSGTVKAFGGMNLDPKVIKSRIGMLSHEPYLYGELTAMENLRFFCQLYGVQDGEGRSKAMLKEVGLYARAHDRADTFSRGMRQRLGLARALLHDPDLILLDEPYTGLDLRARTTLDRLVREKGEQGKAFIAITHDLERGLEMATRVGLLSKGRIVLEADSGDWGEFPDRYIEVMGGGRP